MILSGKYEVTEKVGQGGMGIVYRVRHLDLDTVLALKILPRELSQDPDLVERFRREARMMARLNHTNIVRVFDFAKDGDTYYLIMEFLSGRNLRQILQEHLERTRKPMPLPEILRVGSQIAEALAYAHEQTPAVVHRDIKPSNIIIEEGTDRAVVTDFGIAKLMGESQSELTHTGLFVGTVKYCAPEQLRHDDDLDARVDLYALGMMLFELYTGKQYFAGLKDHEVIGKVLYEKGENVVELPDTPPEFNALVTKAIARDRDARHASAQELLADLQACLRIIGGQGDVTGTATAGTAGGADEIEAQIRALERVRLQKLAEEARDACQLARADAERSGAEAEDADAFAAAVAVQEAGDALVAEGEHEQAAGRLREAADAFAAVAATAARRRAERGVAQAREAADDLQRQAVEGGAGDEALAQANAVLAGAEKLAESGEYDRAVAEFGEAAEAYGAVLADLKRAEELNALRAAMPDIQAARQRAEEANAPALAADAFTAAVRDQERFEQALAAEQLTAAQELVGLVQSAFDAAADGARTAHLRDEALQARAAMEEQRAAATEAAAGIEPPAEMESAAARAGEAAELERDGDWATALVAYQEAAKLYAQATELARTRAAEVRAETALAEAKAACDDAQARAKEADASKGAPTLFGRARDLAKKAAKQSKAGDAGEAAGSYRQAAEQYAQAVQVAERRAQRDALEKALAEAATARAAAEKAGGQETERFAEAERATAEAERALESDDLTAGAQSAAAARQAFEAARSDAELSAHLAEADTALAAAAGRRDDAVAAGAAEVSGSGHAEAAGLLEQATTARAGNDWERAIELAGQAGTAFGRSIDATVDAAEADAAQAADAARAAGVPDGDLADAEAARREAADKRSSGAPAEAAKAFRDAAAGYRAATDRTGGAATEARDAAAAARRVADEADARTHAAAVYDPAATAFDTAERELGAQHFSAAVASYREAAAGFEAATAAAAKARASAASTEARAEAEREQQAATAAEAPEYVPDDFESASRDFRDGESALAEEDFAAAEASFRSAASAFRVVVTASERVRAEREAHALRDQARALRALRDPDREPRGARRKIKRADNAIGKGERLLDGGGDLGKAQAEFRRAVETLEALPPPPEAEDATSMATIVRPAPSQTRSIPWVPIAGGLAVALLVAGWLVLRPTAPVGVGTPEVAVVEPEPPVEAEPAKEAQEDTAVEEKPAQVAAVEPEPATPVPEPTPPPAPEIRRVEPDEAAIKLEAGSEASFKVELADASDVSWEWKVGGEVVSDADGATLTLPVPDEPSTVVVVAMNPGGAVEHSWELAALPRATEVPPPAPKAPEIVKAAPRGRGLSVGVGKRQRFTVEVASADDSLSYAWTVDGRNVGRDRAFTLAPKATDEGETRKVKVSVKDSQGETVSREWEIKIPTEPIRIVRQRPGNDATFAMGERADLSIEARVGDRKVPFEYRWSVDGKRVASATGPTFRHEIDQPQTRVEVRVESPGRQAAVRSWRLRGQRPPEPTPPPAPKPPPEPEPPVAADVEGEIRAWIEAYRAAYEQKNVDRLVSLGVLGSGNRDRMADALRDLDGLSVRIVNRSIDVQGPDRAVVSLTRVDSFSAGRGREEKSIPIKKTLRKRNGRWVAE